jgi:hypothetical protein
MRCRFLLRLCQISTRIHPANAGDNRRNKSGKYGQEIIFKQIFTKIFTSQQLATERFMCVRTIRAFGAEEKELKNYRQQIDQIWDVSWRDGRLNAMIFSG